jgi:hypothetical protein
VAFSFKIPDTWRDTAERLFWTALSAVLGALPPILADLPGNDAWWFPVLTFVVNWVTIELRKRTPVLPSPGEGLPALPTGVEMVDANSPHG